MNDKNNSKKSVTYGVTLMTKMTSSLLCKISNSDNKAPIEFISSKETNFIQVEREDILEYLELMARELSTLATQENIPFIACLLNMVAREAYDLKHDEDHTLQVA